mmetsp:Transcript_10702/g.28547  ORF Transcript_10702/g.28547 Transcript_10702/m.28547 type:complete len:705 (-) Transcript_10702:1424-3538(-)|eukprot:CAMPEP_0119493320 /NCGR_PEP_ID=MMETSP1344-20130328/17602_1 /TAXON_ID=236787 /ORGANISM="Florenciella parvula, Strain CCMP2471" /LENGTH=704 /DNA_ID=CAMNT_0007528733 /DNA_START=401 /DNA_END=2515 /DNA_ORIENTATION=-
MSTIRDYFCLVCCCRKNAILPHVLKIDKEPHTKGFPLELLDPHSFVALRTFCREHDITQRYLDHTYARFRDNIERPKHPNGLKKRTNRISLAAFQDEFDFLTVESVSQLFIPGLFHEELDNIRNVDDRTKDVVDFTRFIVAAYEMLKKNDLEMIMYFFAQLLPSYKVKDDTVVNRIAFEQIIKSLHGDVPYQIQILMDDIKMDVYSLADVVGFAFLYPPLLYPVIEFQRAFRHKVFGTKFWMEEGRINADDEALMKEYGIGDVMAKTFDHVKNPEDAWRVAAHHMHLKMLYDMKKLDIFESNQGKKKTKEKLKKKKSKRGKLNKGLSTRNHNASKDTAGSNLLEHDPIPVMFKRIETKLYPLCVELDFDKEETRSMMVDRFGYKVGQMFTDFMFVSLPDKEKVREIQHRESEVGRKDHLRRESHSGRAKSFLSHMAHDVIHLAEEIAHHETKHEAYVDPFPIGDDVDKPSKFPDLPWNHSMVGPAQAATVAAWERVLEPKSETYFWYNTITGDTQWTKPLMNLKWTRDEVDPHHPHRIPETHWVEPANPFKVEHKGDLSEEDAAKAEGKKPKAEEGEAKDGEEGGESKDGESKEGESEESESKATDEGGGDDGGEKKDDADSTDAHTPSEAGDGKDERSAPTDDEPDTAATDAASGEGTSSTGELGTCKPDTGEPPDSGGGPDKGESAALLPDSKADGSGTGAG